MIDRRRGVEDDRRHFRFGDELRHRQRVRRERVSADELHFLAQDQFFRELPRLGRVRAADVAIDHFDLVAVHRVAVVLLIDRDRLLELFAPACKAAGEHAEHADLHGLRSRGAGEREQCAGRAQANQPFPHVTLPCARFGELRFRRRISSTWRVGRAALSAILRLLLRFSLRTSRISDYAQSGLATKTRIRKSSFCDSTPNPRQPVEREGLRKRCPQSRGSQRWAEKFVRKQWCRQRDLNPRPPAYEADALPLSYAGPMHAMASVSRRFRARP